MPENKIYIAAAGSGKTTFIIEQVKGMLRNAQDCAKKIFVITYTQNNQENIIRRFQTIYGNMPNKVIVIGWFSFLLDYWIRPFKGTVIESLYDRHVGLIMTEQISGVKTNSNGTHWTTYKNDTEKFLCKNGSKLYSDKLSEFAYRCWEKNKGTLLSRLFEITDTIFIDEAQDLVAWDFEIIKLLMQKSNVKCVLCGDPRQHTFSTSPSSKNNIGVR